MCLFFICRLLGHDWTFSYLMDDHEYFRILKAPAHFWDVFLSELQRFYHLGRFTPVKLIYNIVKWRWLPESPEFFGLCNFLINVLVAGAGSLLVVEKCGVSRKSFLKIFLWALAFLMAQVCWLQTFILNSPGESLLTLWVLIGFYLISKSKNSMADQFGARVFFLLAALTKEPGAFVFFASAFQNRGLAPRYSFFRFFDLFLGIGLTASFWFIKHKGSYLGNYGGDGSRILLQAVQIAFRVGAGILPLLAAILLGSNLKDTKNILNKFSGLLLFSFLYALAIAPQSSAHYLLPPVTVGFWILGLANLLNLDFSKTPVKIYSWFFIWIFCFSISQKRFFEFASAQSQANHLIQSTIENPSRSTVFFLNAPEAVDNLKASSVPAYFVEEGIKPYVEKDLCSINPKPDEMELVEFTTLYGSYSQEIVGSFQTTFGPSIKFSEGPFMKYWVFKFLKNQCP